MPPTRVNTSADHPTLTEHQERLLRWERPFCVRASCVSHDATTSFACREWAQEPGGV